jgi:low affinity Fe/Cu permease
MMDKAIEKLFNSLALVVLVAGVILIITGAANGLPIGNPPLTLAGLEWQIVLAIVGSILVLFGLIFVASDVGIFSFKGKIKIIKENELVSYMINAIKNAQSSVCDMTWAAPMQSTVTINERLRDEYYSAIEFSTNKPDKPIRYREIMMFHGLEQRILKAERLLEKAGKGYELAAYPDLPYNAPRRHQFVIIDESEVILKNISVRIPEVVKYFVHCYNDWWADAVPIRVSDYEPNMELINIAKEKAKAKQVQTHSKKSIVDKQ